MQWSYYDIQFWCGTRFSPSGHPVASFLDHLGVTDLSLLPELKCIHNLWFIHFNINLLPLNKQHVIDHSLSNSMRVGHQCQSRQSSSHSSPDCQWDLLSYRTVQWEGADLELGGGKYGGDQFDRPGQSLKSSRMIQSIRCESAPVKGCGINCFLVGKSEVDLMVWLSL